MRAQRKKNWMCTNSRRYDKINLPTSQCLFHAMCQQNTKQQKMVKWLTSIFSRFHFFPDCHSSILSLAEFNNNTNDFLFKLRMYVGCDLIIKIPRTLPAKMNCITLHTNFVLETNEWALEWKNDDPKVFQKWFWKEGKAVLLFCSPFLSCSDKETKLDTNRCAVKTHINCTSKWFNVH